MPVRTKLLPQNIFILTVNSKWVHPVYYRICCFCTLTRRMGVYLPAFINLPMYKLDMNGVSAKSSGIESRIYQFRIQHFTTELPPPGSWTDQNISHSSLLLLSLLPSYTVLFRIYLSNINVEEVQCLSRDILRSVIQLTGLQYGKPKIPRTWSTPHLVLGVSLMFQSGLGDNRSCEYHVR